MTADDRATALQSLGYAPRQAAFLALVAVHGGYFLRRHYAAFLGRPDGGVVTDLLRRVVAWGHASRHTVARDTHLYHLCARPIYAVLGEHASRFRRPALPPAVTRRLMTVDLVLAWRDRTVLATAADKVEYFTETWGIPMSALPTAAAGRTRREHRARTPSFVDQMPIVLTAGSAEVTFAYVQGWSQGLGGFETFLRQHRELITRLPAVCVCYATSRPGLVPLAERTWSRVFPDARPTQVGAPTPEHLVAHFRLRQRLEQGGPWALAADEHAQYTADQARLAGARWEPWYVRWSAAGDVVLEALRAPVVPVSAGARPRFEPFLLTRWYPLFSPLEARHDTHRPAA